MWQSKLVRESTKQGNDKVARQMEAAHRTSLAKGEVGIRDKQPSPTFAAFCAERLKPWAKARPSWRWFRSGINPLLGCKAFSILKLEIITSENVSAYAAYRQTLQME